MISRTLGLAMRGTVGGDGPLRSSPCGYPRSPGRWDMPTNFDRQCCRRFSEQLRVRVRSQFEAPRMTARLEFQDMTDHRDLAESKEPIELAEPTENAERTDPIDPIESAEPIDPIDRIEFFDPIDRKEFSDHSDHLELLARDSMTHSAQIGRAHV